MEWKIAGPYTEQGKNATDLFDIPFDPEKTGKAKWLHHKGGGSTPWHVNLSGFGGFAGNDRVAYMRAKVWSPENQKARLDVTTDDGVKVFLNKKVVHKANIARPPFHADKVNISLNKGWNTLLLKVTNFDGGWEAWARVVAPDGNRLRGLRIQAE